MSAVVVINNLDDIDDDVASTLLGLGLDMYGYQKGIYYVSVVDDDKIVKYNK